jgi:ABC-type sulfate/molybdate transport systems ATPase subunit
MTTLELDQLTSTALAPVTVRIPAGECATLTGPSGSGKTRLLRAIADLDPHEGAVSLGDIAQDQLSGPEWRRRVGFLPAESHWWHTLVRDHFPNPDLPLLQALDLNEECLDWEINRLSSGERQRLALARLLLGKPEALLLDEPTANLDQSNSSRVEQLVRDYRDSTGATVIWVSHDPEQRRRVGSRSFVIRDGNLEEEQWS